jgi:hypothetical protein
MFAVAPLIDVDEGNGAKVMLRSKRNRATLVELCSVSAVSVLTVFVNTARAEQPPAPCHPNPTADADEAAVRSRGDVVNLPGPLQDRLAQLANRPHTYLPLQAFNEADGADQLFQYYPLDTTGFEPNVFTTIFPGVNDHVQLTVTGANCGLPTVGAIRVALEPKPGLPTDPNDPRAFNDVFIDMNPLFVINNESGWYEGWMIHNITVPVTAPPRLDGHAQFGTLTQRLYLPPAVFNRFAVTREINDGLLAPRFAPSQRAWVLSGVQVPVNPPVNASTRRDADDR